jgi:hydrogen peroxide-dependent heme synthase
MFRFDWKAWRKVPDSQREEIVQKATRLFQEIEHNAGPDSPCQSALYSQLGHKGDLMMIHLRESVEALNQVELELAQSELSDFLEAKYSYLSVVELGLYESSAKTYAALSASGLEPHTPEWNAAINDVLKRQADAMAPRLYPSVPEAKYLCFYPMDRRRGEQVNWYTVSMEERQRLMHDHGLIGRRYAGEVRQIITGSIGWDDWEWGVDLFADDPLVFKKLIYEMRFDEASSLYAIFGPFYLGVRLPVDKLGDWLMRDK